jgi:RNA processing factor Prp31
MSCAFVPAAARLAASKGTLLARVDAYGQDFSGEVCAACLGGTAYG